LLTSDKRQRLRVDLGDFEGNTSYAEYDNFVVDSAKAKYRLDALGTYNGTAGQYGMECVNTIVLYVFYETGVPVLGERTRPPR